MAIDTTALINVYDVFLTNTIDKLKDLQAETQMEDEHFATTASTAIVGAMDSSVRLFQIDLQISSEMARTQMQIASEESRTQMQITAEAPLRAAQVLSEGSRKALLDQQKLTEIQQTAKAGFEATELLPAQKTQTINQGLLIARQTVGFDDKKRVEQATQAGGLVGMIYASGGDVPADAWTYAKGKVEAI